MLHKAWNSKGEMPYCFPRSSIKFQGHTVQNFTDFDPNWAFPDCRPVAAFKSLRFALLVQMYFFICNSMLINQQAYLHDAIWLQYWIQRSSHDNCDYNCWWICSPQIRGKPFPRLDRVQHKRGTIFMATVLSFYRVVKMWCHYIHYMLHGCFIWLSFGCYFSLLYGMGTFGKYKIYFI